MLKIGSHVSMAAPDYLVGSVNEALSYQASALMLYTGAPQNAKRIPVSQLKVQQANDIWQKAGFEMDSMIIHAPYLINLANTVNPDTYQLGVNLLKTEILRTAAIGAKYIVLHPGAFLSATLPQGIEQIAKGLDTVLNETDAAVCVCLETMAGKGTEVGSRFEQLNQIISLSTNQDRLGVCLDTCHINDAGYDLKDFDHILDDFDASIGLNRLHVIHVNDSKNPMGAHKDRHANIGSGEIGFETLNGIVHHPRLDNQVFILETPKIGGQAPYGYEIAMLRKGEYTPIPLSED